MFTREDTKAIKGVAIVLMLFHHIAGFPGRFPVGFDGFSSIWKGFADNEYLQEFAFSGQICVSIFFFLGGYGLYKRWEAGKFSLTDSVVSLYKQYWKIFIIFIPIAFLFFARTGDDISSLASRYMIDSKKEFISALISNFFGYSNSFNGEWWFFSAYLCVLPLGCLMLMAIKNNRDFLKDAFIVILINIFICNIFPNLNNTEIFSNINDNIFYNRFFLTLGYESAFFEGIVFAKYEALSVLKKRIKGIPLQKILCISGIAAIFWSKSYIAGGATPDMIYVPFFIAFASNLLDDLRVLNKMFSYLGKHSTNMWYIHSFYCYYFYEITKIVYSTKNVWIDLLILIIMSLATSVLIEFVYNRLKKLRYVYAQAK